MKHLSFFAGALLCVSVTSTAWANGAVFAVVMNQQAAAAKSKLLQSEAESSKVIPLNPDMNQGFLTGKMLAPYQFTELTVVPPMGQVSAHKRLGVAGKYVLVYPDDDNLFVTGCRLMNDTRTSQAKDSRVLRCEGAEGNGRLSLSEIAQAYTKNADTKATGYTINPLSDSFVLYYEMPKQLSPTAQALKNAYIQGAARSIREQ